ncbi:hypothetical protein [Fulvimonas soli]|jgi:hypothetical protein|uniref:hypothetical protein n=1 Tax=Fulvimonas soli TaxID=155197 RepID=UPI00111E46A5|nr:hypothetical protein [Fulvimonas soli]
MSTERAWLLKAIGEMLLPEFLRKGFENFTLPRSMVGPVDREFIISHPFGLLRRHSERGIEQVEIHLASKARGAFNLTFGVIPRGGIDSVFGRIDAGESLVTWMDEFFGLYCNPKSFKPFAVHGRWWSRKEVTEADCIALVNKVINLIPEIERALSKGEVGPHVRRMVRGKRPPDD